MDFDVAIKQEIKEEPEDSDNDVVNPLEDPISKKSTKKSKSKSQSQKSTSQKSVSHHDEVMLNLTEKQKILLEKNKNRSLRPCAMSFCEQDCKICMRPNCKKCRNCLSKQRCIKRNCPKFADIKKQKKLLAEEETICDCGVPYKSKRAYSRHINNRVCMRNPPPGVQARINLMECNNCSEKFKYIADFFDHCKTEDGCNEKEYWLLCTICTLKIKPLLFYRHLVGHNTRVEKPKHKNVVFIESEENIKHDIKEEKLENLVDDPLNVSEYTAKGHKSPLKHKSYDNEEEVLPDTNNMDDDNFYCSENNRNKDPLEDLSVEEDEFETDTSDLNTDNNIKDFKLIDYANHTKEVKYKKSFNLENKQGQKREKELKTSSKLNTSSKQGSNSTSSCHSSQIIKQLTAQEAQQMVNNGKLIPIFLSKESYEKVGKKEIKEEPGYDINPQPNKKIECNEQDTIEIDNLKSSNNKPKSQLKIDLTKESGKSQPIINSSEELTFAENKRLRLKKQRKLTNEKNTEPKKKGMYLFKRSSCQLGCLICERPNCKACKKCVNNQRCELRDCPKYAQQRQEIKNRSIKKTICDCGVPYRSQQAHSRHINRGLCIRIPLPGVKPTINLMKCINCSEEFKYIADLLDHCKTEEGCNEKEYWLLCTICNIKIEPLGFYRHFHGHTNKVAKRKQKDVEFIESKEIIKHEIKEEKFENLVDDPLNVSEYAAQGRKSPLKHTNNIDYDNFYCSENIRNKDPLEDSRDDNDDIETDTSDLNADDNIKDSKFIDYSNHTKEVKYKKSSNLENKQGQKRKKELKLKEFKKSTKCKTSSKQGTSSSRSCHSSQVIKQLTAQEAQQMVNNGKIIPAFLSKESKDVGTYEEVGKKYIKEEPEELTFTEKQRLRLNKQKNLTNEKNAEPKKKRMHFFKRSSCELGCLICERPNCKACKKCVNNQRCELRNCPKYAQQRQEIKNRSMKKTVCDCGVPYPSEASRKRHTQRGFCLTNPLKGTEGRSVWVKCTNCCKCFEKIKDFFNHCNASDVCLKTEYNLLCHLCNLYIKPSSFSKHLAGHFSGKDKNKFKHKHKLQSSSQKQNIKEEYKPELVDDPGVTTDQIIDSDDLIGTDDYVVKDEINDEYEDIYIDDPIF